MAVHSDRAKPRHGKQCPSLRQQMIVVQILLAENGAQHQCSPADRRPVSGEDAPDAEKGGDAADIALQSRKRAFDGFEERTPSAANQESVQIKQRTAREKQNAVLNARLIR